MRGLWVMVIALAVFAAGCANASATALFGGTVAGVAPFSIASDGSVAPVACPACNVGGVWGVAASPNGHFAFATQPGNGSSNGAVEPFSVASTGALSPVVNGCSAPANCTTQEQPEGLAVSPSGGFLYVANDHSQSISVFVIGPMGKLRPDGSPTATAAASPASLAITPNGQYLYAVTGTQLEAFKIAADGTLSALTCGTICDGTFNGGPVAITPSGNFMYALALGVSKVVPYAINGDGSLSAITCSGPSCTDGGGGEASSAISPNGHYLYLTNDPPPGAGILVWAINPDGTITPQTCGSGCSAATYPVGVTLSPSGNSLYAMDYSAGTVLPFSVTGNGLLSPITCSPALNCSTGAQADNFQDIAAQPDQAPTAALTGAPAAATSPTAFDASASTAPPGGQVTRWDWSFGDGSTLSNGGAKVTHTYAAPGTYTATVTVSDEDGCSNALIFTGQTAYCNGGPSATTTVTFTVPPKGSPPPPPVTSSPTLTSVSQSHSVWREGSALASLARRRPPIGTTFRFTLNESARVSLVFSQRRSGRRIAAHRCVAPNRRNARKRHCRLTVTVGTLSFAGHAGTDRVRFQGRPSRRRRLPPGVYSVTITATSAGHSSAPKTLTFRIVRG